MDILLTIDLYEENDRRLYYEGYPKYDDEFPAVSAIHSNLNIINPNNTDLVNFLCSWKEYLRLASINFRKKGSKCGICTAYTTWLGQKDYIPAVAASPIFIKSMTDFLNIGHRTGKFSAFIVALKFGWPITSHEQKMLIPCRGSLHFDLYMDQLGQLEGSGVLQGLHTLIILRNLLLSRSHLP
jgi:hypothetical protein